MINNLTNLTYTLLGGSGFGKTSYLYATYLRMIEGVSGFELTSRNSALGFELLNDCAKTLKDGVWPFGTECSREFEFSCLYNGKSFGRFTWLDYRGGALQQRSEGNNETAQLCQRIEDSDVVLTCLPVDGLMSLFGDEKRGRWLRGQFLNIYRYMLGAAHRAKTLIFMLTKSDLCDGKEEMRLCIRAIHTLFKGCFCDDAFNRVMIAIPRLGRFEGDEEGRFFQGCYFEGVLDPYNVHLPILFPFYSALQADGSAEAQEIADAIWREIDGRVDLYEGGRYVLNASGVVF